MHWQTVLPTLGLLALDIKVQLTQVLLMMTLSTVLHLLHVLLAAFKTKPLGQ
jgi:hypothetical protein